MVVNLVYTYADNSRSHDLNRKVLKCITKKIGMFSLNACKFFLEHANIIHASI